MPTIVVFCHLRWDFVYQRPQQLLSRLAQHYRILFVEEPVHKHGDSFMEQSHPAPGITVCRPHTPVLAPGFHDDQIPLLQPMLAALLPRGERPIVWFYTPMALPLLQELRPGLVVYDCMDELAAFKNSPKQLLQRETALLALADLVFAGGPSLYQAKRARHANVHCFPSSVDVRHFEQALVRSTSHAAQAAIAQPRLGFYGVIDERFDTALIAHLAAAHPAWQIVLVGPVIKIDAATLPQGPNIHYLGQHGYDALPGFLAGWDVCLLPFALNEATRLISPTKVLEYMAAELPIVSTPIVDVAQPYGHVVAIAADAGSFGAACEQALALTPAARERMRATMRAIVAGTSWDVTAGAMHDLLAATPARRGTARFATPDPAALEISHAGAGAGAHAGAAGGDGSGSGSGSRAGKLAGAGPAAGGNAGGVAKVNPLRSQSGAQKVATVIIGAGPTGLSAAYHLGEGALLLDKNTSVGGWCRSIHDQGFTFDHAGHIMFSNDPYVLQLYELLLGPNVHWQNREAWIYSKQVYTRYPFQGALYGLPPKVITECIVGAVEARFGNIDGAPGAQHGAARPVEDCCADGTVEIGNTTATITPRKRDTQQAPRNFEDFIYQVWGRGIAEHFAIPYNRKLWTVPLREMETSWLGGRVPLPDLQEIIEGALQPVAKPMGPNARFGYPLSGGFQALMSGFLPHIKGKIEMQAEAAQLLPREHVLVMADGSRYRYDHLVSTMPLPELIRLIGAEAPDAVRAAARGLRHLSVRCVNLGVARENLTDKHWIYYPEDTIFHRIFVQGNASPHCNPPGGFGLTCEISYSPWKPLPLDGKALIERCIDDCIKVGMLRPEDKIITANLVDMPYAYVVYDHARAANVALVKAWLARYDIVLAGRYSEWEYYNSDHAFLAGKKAAETVLRLRASAAQNVGSE